VCVAVALGCAEPTYHGEGDVVAVDVPGWKVTIAHDDIPGLMPAMTMTFPVRSSDVLADVRAGDRIRFDVARSGEALTVVRIVPPRGAARGRPGLHDHTPHHGGVVAMAGLLHLEAVARRDGRLRVYLSDVWRRPLPPTGAAAGVTLGLAGARRTVPLVATRDAADEFLEAVAPAFDGPDVVADVRLEREGQRVEMHFVLPLDGGRGGGVPAGPCAPPEPAAGRAPRCVLAFPLPVTFAAATPDGATGLVAAVGAGVTAWRMPAGEFAFAFAPPPPRPVPADEPPHGDAAVLIAVDPAGREATVALQQSLLRYDVATGRLLGEIPLSGNLARSVAYSPDGTRLLASVSGDARAHLFATADGTALRTLPVELEAAAVAFSPDGTRALVGSEAGTIAVFDLATDAPARLVPVARRPVEALAFAGDRLVAAGADGVRVWRDGLDAPATLVDPEPAVRLAVAPGGRVIAVGRRDRTIRLHDVESGPLETLAWHRAGVAALAWAGSVLVSGDTEGRLALWDVTLP
jgi:Cu/Ag efflux protein CusF/DNA-binding beta-propeller fold protein YncE